MSHQDMFQGPEDLARDLAREIREMKEVLREIAKRLSQVEIRARRGFPSAFPLVSKKRPDKPPNLLVDAPTFSPDEALRYYDQLVADARHGDREGVQGRLASLDLPNLVFLCRELGVSLGKKKPSRPNLITGVLGRINQSVMLSGSNLRNRPETNGASRTEDEEVIPKKET